MFQLFVVAISIGLADSLNPSTIAPALYLASASGGLRRVLAFTLGAFSVYFGAGVVVALGPGHFLVALIPRPRAHTRYLIEVAVGAALAIAAVIVWLRRRRLAERPVQPVATQRRPAALLGASIMAVELPTAFPYFAAIAAFVGSGLGVFRQLLLLAIFNVCFVLPLLAIALMLGVGGARARKLLDRGRKMLVRRWPQALAIVLALIGAFVAVLGATGLVGSGHGQFARVAHRVHHVLTP